MSKKSSTNRQRSASHARTGASTKAQAARQASTATLVRAGGQDAAEQDTPRAANPPADNPTPSPASIVRDTPAAPARTVAPTRPATPAKPAALKATAPITPPARAMAPAARPAPAATTQTNPAPAAPARRQDTRLARARATQRARQAGLISSDNYAYVIGDLKLIAGLAVGALAILIVLTYVLPR